MCDACVLREAKERDRKMLEKAKQEPSLSSDLVSLRWSSEPPTETGWYWLRSAPSEDSDPNDNEDAEIVLVRGDTETCPKRVLSIDGNRSFLTTYTDRPGYVQWAGPLPFPIAN